MPPSKGRGRKKKTRKKIDGAKNATDNTTKEFRDELLSRVLYINSETAKEQATLTEFQQRVENMTSFWVIEKEKLEVSQHCLCFLRKISFSFFLHLRSESAPLLSNVVFHSIHHYTPVRLCRTKRPVARPKKPSCSLFTIYIDFQLMRSGRKSSHFFVSSRMKSLRKGPEFKLN